LPRFFSRDDRIAYRGGKPAANDILEFDRPYKSNRGARVRALGGLGAVGIQLGIDAINAG
jgi:hypothetical protein